jgi:hypothetical protein
VVRVSCFTFRKRGSRVFFALTGAFDREEGAYGYGLDIPSEAEQSATAGVARRRCRGRRQRHLGGRDLCWPPHEGPTAVCADQGIAIGGKVNGSTINNTVSGGAATAGPCVTSSKK